MKVLKNGPLTSEGSLSAGFLSQSKDSAKTNNLGGVSVDKDDLESHDDDAQHRNNRLTNIYGDKENVTVKTDSTEYFQDYTHAQKFTNVSVLGLFTSFNMKQSSPWWRPCSLTLTPSMRERLGTQLEICTRCVESSTTT